LKYDKSIIIKPKIGGPPLAIFPESLDPHRHFGKILTYPSTLAWIFNPCASIYARDAYRLKMQRGGPDGPEAYPIFLRHRMYYEII
jgi:hypothetical protein